MSRTPGALVAMFLSLLLGAGSMAQAQSARDTAVEVSAVVQNLPPQITLSWLPSGYAINLQKIYRRLKGAPFWTELATPGPTAVTYIDTAVSAGVSYEYFLYRDFAGPELQVAAGYLNAGIALPAVEHRGKALLFVDDTMVVPLAAELSRFEQDLTGDGWTVLRQEVSRAASVAWVKATIQALYQLDPANTRSLILFGRIPVPYSGNLAPDGHGDHAGAWPADVFYGDMDGTWTDDLVNTTSASRPENRNTPEDLKYDQSTLPSDVELEVGRIDFAGVVNVPTSLSETELLRQYLNRNHDFRHRLGNFANVARRGLIDDNFGYFGGEAFSATAWRNFTAFFGSAPGSVAELDWFGTLGTQSYLWAYGCGAGGYGSAGGVGASGDFAASKSLAVFNVLFGSYFGDWDTTDSLLRAPLAGHPESLGLVSLWAGRPPWHLYHMALGETVGYGARLTQNNYGALSSGYLVTSSGRSIHIALMGDPTLRLHPVFPVTNLTAGVGIGGPELTWTASADTNLQGYTLLRAGSPTGPFQRIRNALISGTAYTDRTAVPGQSYTYMVRTLKLESSASGTYSNGAQGVLVSGNAAGPVAREMNLTGHGEVIPSGDTGVAPDNGTDFGRAEVNVQSVIQTFTIANDGTGPLHLTATPRVNIAGPPEGDFTVETIPPDTIAGGNSATFQLKFSPKVLGLRSAMVSITNDDSDEGSYTFAIQGTGLPPTPEIAVTPTPIVRAVGPGGSAVQNITVANTGPGALHYTLTSSQDTYSFRDSNSFGGPSYAWIDIVGTGTEATGFGNPDDGITAPIALGFAFPFYGSSFNSVRVCTNGFVSLTDAAVPFGNTSLPSPGAPQNMIAALWDDLILEGGSKVFTQQMGGVFVIQYEDVQIFGAPTQRATFQIVLKPSGEILLQYKTSTVTNPDYTVGIQNGARTDGLQIALNTAYAQPGLAVRIAPPGLDSWLTLNSAGGTIAPSGTQPVQATLNAAGLAPGSYFATIAVASDDVDESLLTIPVQFTVLHPIEVWRLAHFQVTADAGDAADGADPDFDGISNLEEYALTLDPLGNGAAGLPGVTINAGGYLQISFTRNSTRTDLTYEVEAGSDLIGWTTIARSVRGAVTTAVGAHGVNESGGGEVKSVVVEDSVAASGWPARFLRLHILHD
jgi:hypothetical protein